MALVLSLIILVLAGWGVWLQVRPHEPHYYVAEYVFFLRVPLLAAAFLILFPLVGPRAAPALLGNVFILTPWQALIVGFEAGVSILSIAYVFALILKTAPVRTGLPLKEGWPHAAKDDRGHVLREREAFASALLSLALLWRLRGDSEADYMATLTAFLGGLVAAFMLRAIVSRFMRESGAIADTAKAPKGWLGKLLFPALVGCHGIFTSTPDDVAFAVRAHRRALSFGVAVVMVFWSGALLTGPLFPRVFTSTPALFHVVAACIAATWFLSWLTFKLDVYRLPILMLMAASVIGLRAVFPAGHIYELSAWPANAPRESATTSLNAVMKTRGDTLVVVAASGGGITASLWTTYVLDQLDHESAITPRFATRVSAISGVSGGSVGTMFYMDGFVGANTPTDSESKAIVARSASSSLGEAMWGMVYADVPRLFGVGFFEGRYDRGWSLEQAWRSRMNTSGATLGSWAPVNGSLPIVLMSATLEETGERWVLSPVRLTPRDGRRNLEDIIGEGRDVAAVTAARLSATFPYVSPSAAPDRAGSGLHTADGGYYDNSGIVTLLDMLNYWLRDTPPEQRTVHRIALIEIRASGTIEQAVSHGPANEDLMLTTLGPILTLEHARGSSQLSRADAEMDLSRGAWAGQGLTFDHFLFRLSGEQPLSWHLSEDEKQDIKAHWPGGASSKPLVADAAKDNRDELNRLIAFLR